MRVTMSNKIFPDKEEIYWALVVLSPRKGIRISAFVYDGLAGTVRPSWLDYPLGRDVANCLLSQAFSAYEWTGHSGPVQETPAVGSVNENTAPCGELGAAHRRPP